MAAGIRGCFIQAGTAGGMQLDIKIGDLNTKQCVSGTYGGSYRYALFIAQGTGMWHGVYRDGKR